MLLDARQMADRATVSGDVCIVGAGAAGITIADALRGSGLQVLLLESGGFESDAATAALAHGRNTGQPLDPTGAVTLDEVRLRWFGGTTNHWAGWCKPLQPEDLDARPEIGRIGWPISAAEFARWYPEAHRVCGIGPVEFSWSWWHEHAGGAPPILDSGTVETTAIQVSGRPRFGDNARDELTQASDVSLCLWANVTRIALSSDGARVDHLDVATITGRRFVARARLYVLATGGIEVPRLLLASNDVRSAGVGNGHDLVGRNFMEHLTAVGGFAALAANAQQGSLFVSREYDVVDTTGAPAKVEALAVMAITPAARRAHGLLGLDIEPLFQVFPLEEKLPYPQKDLTIAQVAPLAEAIEGKPYRSQMVIRVVGEQLGNPESRVTLDRATDALGIPRAQLHWRISRADRESIARGLALFARELGRRQLGRVRIEVEGHSPKSVSDEDVADFDFSPTQSFHHMGTARMHQDPTRGVVDRDCRVHDVANLFVAGSAVFPSTSMATPTLTLVALALRLAAHLRTELA